MRSGMGEWMAMEERLEEWCVKVRGVGSVGASGVTREELGLELTQLGTLLVKISNQTLKD